MVNNFMQIAQKGKQSFRAAKEKADALENGTSELEMWISHKTLKTRVIFAVALRLFSETSIWKTTLNFSNRLGEY